VAEVVTLFGVVRWTDGSVGVCDVDAKLCSEGVAIEFCKGDTHNLRVEWFEGLHCFGGSEIRGTVELERVKHRDIGVGTKPVRLRLRNPIEPIN